MPEHRLKPQLSLAGATPRTDRFAGLTITENGSLALASLACRRGRDADFAAAAQSLFGFAMPGPGRFTSRPPFTAYWTGPGQWFVEAPFETHEEIARILKEKMQGTASVTEQTDGWARFDIEGARLADVFERLCGLDVRAMQAGDVSRTIIEHLGVLVACGIAGQRLSLLGPRSAARSLHHALVTAAKSAL